jgi:hypothetical protein
MSTLKELMSEFYAIESQIVAAGGELPPGSDLEMKWDALCTAMTEKADNCALYIIDLRARAEARREAHKKGLAACDAMDKLADRFLRHIDFVMGERKEIAGETFTLRRVANPPKVDVLEEWKVKMYLPECVKRGEPMPHGSYELRMSPDGGSEVIPLSIDKNVLRRALLDGKCIDGATITRGHRIDVR